MTEAIAFSYSSAANHQSNVGTWIGGFASIAIVLLWLLTFHKKFFLSLLHTEKVNAYGVYTDFGEVMRTHFWYLMKRIGKPQDVELRQELETKVEGLFYEQLGDPESKQVLVTHSCRSIFYYIVRTLLEEAQERTGEMRIKIALPSLHFGSFYRLLRGMEKSMKCKIDFYEIDLNKDDWTLDQENIDEKELSQCDMILCQHLFGVPFSQDKLVELGKRHNILLLEDCVQSGSLYGNYKGHPQTDIVMYSGGLDKTPQCFGAGLGHFRDTPLGNHFYQKCNAYHQGLPLDTWKARLISCFNQLIHVMIARNSFGINNLLGLLAYVWVSERGDFIKWYAISLKVRTAKAITPFQHAESGFLRRPSIYQLQSILHGMSKIQEYLRIAKEEIRKRDLLLSNIPKKYHHGLFPWLTPQVLQRHNENTGISEFSWVVSPTGDRMGLCNYLNDQFVVTLINTTWEFHEYTKKPVGRYINNNLVYIPNLNQMTDEQTIYTAQILTRYCQYLETSRDGMVSKAKKGA